MLSKAEIQYLQGQKQISKSYERKLKCLIRKKVTILRKEIPLVSKLFVDSLELSVESPSLDKKTAAPPNRPIKIELNEKDSSQSHLKNSATEFSNLKLNDIEVNAREIVNSQNIGDFTLLDKDKATHATEFGNVRDNCAMKNGNFRYTVNILNLSVNLSNSIHNSHKNPNKSSQKSYFLQWAGSDLYC